jgi:LuxR family maltose regulon positive regulatory protein
VTTTPPPYPRATADLHVGLAELDLELNDLASAEAHLETARALREQASITENRHRWYVAMANVRAARGDLAAAERLFDEAEALYRPGVYPDVRPIPAMRARARIGAGDLVGAGSWAREHEVTAADDVSYLREYDLLTFVRLLLARHRSGAVTAGSGSVDPASSGRILALLERLRADAASRPGSLLEIGMLRALTHHAHGRRPEAVTELQRALTQAPEPGGYVRLFLAEGTPMAALLRDAVDGRNAGSKLLRGHAHRLVRAAEGPRSPAPGRNGSSVSGEPLAALLSGRELDVLRMLDSDLTGPEIARQLFVSLNTFRTHTKRIFTKLDVNNRSAAIRRGHQLGLLGAATPPPGQVTS